ncbi:metal-dependent hydrolase [Aliifodinibius sp. S!AR15-10]|uniref:metal-dependent hydrolase n=1 Tax=Aliifodinibius sp. S!AR15-10 TaxID=2950437 RepID=UPI002867873B|nr:metal-dependent hydrolase [Aliifodinibius sp. S!AR15-10]MDR8393706.1 metal-dependent hydrolase [Aliifodinibius sp. S!AR15-10]
MDTVTQITLGAAIGEAVLGRKAGNRAPMWGALLGIVPDLDVLANPFLNEVQQIIAHRGISHSILFCLVASPVFGWTISRLKWNRDVDWRSWSWLAFWVISTHIFIDVCTSYGTQIFQPFSNYSASLNSIFIIDPFYTLPLLAGILGALFIKRNPQKRRWVNFLGLGVSTFYLLLGFGIKWHVNSVFERNFQRQDMQVERYMTTPAPLTAFLWTGYAESDDHVYAGLYSVFDNDRDIEFTEIPKNSELITAYRGDLPLQRLLWFSHGYYTVQKKSDTVIFSDLRFGRSDLLLSDGDAPFVWNYRLEFNQDSTKVTGFQHYEPSFSTRNNAFGKLFSRILDG